MANKVASSVRTSIPPPPPLAASPVTTTCAEPLCVFTASDTAVTVTVSVPDTAAGGV
jgi:hypothetical protein